MRQKMYGKMKEGKEDEWKKLMRDQLISVTTIIIFFIVQHTRLRSVPVAQSSISLSP
jgi:hypothetical protein